MRKLSLVMISTLGLTGCGDWTMMTATLSNRSREPISDISVDFAGVTRNIDKLQPGDSATVRAFNGRDGRICLRYRQGDARFQHGFGYLTHGAPIDHRILIHGKYIAVSEDSFGISREIWSISRSDPPGKICVSHG